MSNYFNICPTCNHIPDNPGPCDCIDQAGRKIAKRQAQAYREVETLNELEGEACEYF